MISTFVWEELTELHSIMVVQYPREKEYVAEVFIKDNGFIWYSVRRYTKLPSKWMLLRDTYDLKCKSIRPYKAGQHCDGSITAPALHLYAQLCSALQIDPIELYGRIYDDANFTMDQLAETMRFAEWQGVEVITDWNAKMISLVVESLHEVNYHQLANALDECIPV